MGKRLLDIRVVGRNGGAIGLGLSVVRYSIFGLPYFLNGVYFAAGSNDISLLARLLGIALAVVVFGGGFGLIYLIVFNRKTRQSLHDLLTRTFVINLARSGEVVALITPRVHLYVVSVVGLVVVGAAILSAFVVGKPGSGYAQLAAISKSVTSVGGTREVQVWSGFSTTRMASGNNTNIHFLLVSAYVGQRASESDQLTNDIAAAVLKEAPDLLGNDTLVVVLTQGVDIGLAFVE